MHIAVIHFHIHLQSFFEPLDAWSLILPLELTVQSYSSPLPTITEQKLSQGRQAVNVAYVNNSDLYSS